MAHKMIKIEDLNFNPFTLIGKEWMLITAGNINSFNTMTASWGNLGYIWERPVAFCVIRPQRFTRKFVEENEFFTLSFFGREYRSALEICGKYSGKDVNKVEMAKLTPKEDEEFKTVFFDEANLVFVCKKIYFQDIISENFLDKAIYNFYPAKDYHRMFIGEIVKVLKREE
ncbi:flavin reductase family protein [Anaerocellum danielii]|uniref:Flavin reductase n=1 Tax=Anaerocellum danielii TaxID=1387557 RepID=A0ABZ0TWU1_9FIRM|nr:flavin reductase [Caldicellulosiruptor danielii]WPX07714.1 flavin reductase [Caldicellulosiruptor danielii]